MRSNGERERFRGGGTAMRHDPGHDEYLSKLEAPPQGRIAEVNGIRLYFEELPSSKILEKYRRQAK